MPSFGPSICPGPCAIAALAINKLPIAKPARTAIEPFILFPLEPKLFLNKSSSGLICYLD